MKNIVHIVLLFGLMLNPLKASSQTNKEYYLKNAYNFFEKGDYNNAQKALNIYFTGFVVDESDSTYQDASELKNKIQQCKDFVDKAENAIARQQIKVAIDYYRRVLSINPKDSITKRKISELEMSVKNDKLPPSSGNRINSVTDIDGNVYKTVKLGNQVWMAENLRTTRYADGTPIPLGTEASLDDAYRYYPNNNRANVSKYGYLYNWPAVMNGSHSSSANPSGVQGICPDGWHVPSYAEWTELENYVSSQSQYVCGGDEDNIAKALASEEGWNSCADNCAIGNNPDANNATGFSARPAGLYYGNYTNFGSNANFWSATQNGSYAACSRNVGYYYASVLRSNYDKYYGYSVRCVRN